MPVSLTKIQVSYDLAQLSEDIRVVNSVSSELRAIELLRKKYSGEVARFIIEQSKLRKKAENKLPQNIVNVLIYEKEALEQASSWQISQYRIEKAKKIFPKAKRVFDLGCGIGIDSLAFSKYFDVISVEKEIDRFEICKYNLEKTKIQGKASVLHADIQELVNEIKPEDIVFLDPSRREDSKKLRSIFDYQPSLEIIKSILKKTLNIIVKISPAVDMQELLNAEFSSGFNLELISEDNQLKEAVLWFGERDTNKSIATILPQKVSIQGDIDDKISFSEYLYDSDEIDDKDYRNKDQIINENNLIGKFLVEPDASIIRAGLIDKLKESLALEKIDNSIAYLVSDRKLNEKELYYFRNHRQFRVVSVNENNEKAIIEMLLAFDYDFVDIKKRGVGIDPDIIQKRINSRLKKSSEKLSRIKKSKDSVIEQNINNRNAVLFYTYINNQKRVIVTETV